MIPKLQIAYPNETFFGHADHSPIAEKDAAAKAGLGVIGCHSLLINDKYGSYVFIGSILTSIAIDCQSFPIHFCNQCHHCISRCPTQAISENGIDISICLSAVSQKKNLTENESELLKNNHIAWGCDICQSACPFNAKREYTPIPYFQTQRHGAFTATEIEQMDNTTFSQYAFSWRGKTRILNNLQNLFDRQ